MVSRYRFHQIVNYPSSVFRLVLKLYFLFDRFFPVRVELERFQRSISIFDTFLIPCRRDDDISLGLPSVRLSSYNAKLADNFSHFSAVHPV